MPLKRAYHARVGRASPVVDGMSATEMEVEEGEVPTGAAPTSFALAKNCCCSRISRPSSLAIKAESLRNRGKRAGNRVPLMLSLPFPLASLRAVAERRGNPAFGNPDPIIVRVLTVNNLRRPFLSAA